MTLALSPEPFEAQSGRASLSTPDARSSVTGELVEQLRSSTDEVERGRLRQELIEVNIPVACAIARRYRGRGIPSEDLEQVAYLALTKAARRFDPDAGHAFLSFCVPTMTGEVRRYFRDHGWMVRPPRRIQELQQSVRAAQAELAAQLSRPPTAREVAEHVGVRIDEVLEAMDSKGAFTPSSLDAAVTQGESTLGDLLHAEGTEEPAAEARVMLAPLIGRLSDRDRLIVQRRFFDGLTQREIAIELGVTQMQVSRLLARIFHDLRRQLGPLEEPGSLTSTASSPDARIRSPRP